MNDVSLVPNAAEQSALPQEELDRLTDALVEKLKSVFDPEIPVDIYELGLIYRVDVSDDKDAVLQIDDIRSCEVNLVFDPPWDPSRMSDEAKLQLNMF